MKKIILAVIFLAVAGSIYYFLSKQSSNNKYKKLILGSWLLDSTDVAKSKDSSANMLAFLLLAMDSNARKLQFDFNPDGLILTHTGDSTGKDTSHYKWQQNKLIVWSTDTIKQKWNIKILDSAHFVAISEDSITYYLKKIR